MSHELEINEEGAVSMAYAGEVPWHGLGVKVLPDLTPFQMLEAANLNWEVEKRPMQYRVGEKRHLVPGQEALIRSSDQKFFSIVGSDWNPIQNLQAFEFFNEFVAAGNMEMNTAGALFDGKRVWALAKVNKSFEVMPGDQIDQYLLFSNPHEYGKTAEIRWTDIRVVCNNTITAALKDATSGFVKVNHRSEFDSEKVKAVLGLVQTKSDTYQEAAKFLASKSYTVEAMTDYFKEIFPTTGKKDLSLPAKKALEYKDSQPGVEFGEGTWWQIFNTVTYMSDHHFGKNQEKRLENVWFGGGEKKKQTALTKALEYAEAA